MAPETQLRVHFVKSHSVGDSQQRLVMPRDHSQTNFRHLKARDIKLFLEGNLNVIDVINCFVDEKLLSEKQKLDVIRRPEHDQVYWLVHSITEISRPGTVRQFINCLERCGYMHTAKGVKEYLEKLYLRGLSTERAIGLKCGLVPLQPAIFVYRDLIYSLKDVLVRTSGHDRTILKPTSWILIHGMPGSGKTYLAAAALRAPEIWTSCFENGIYWLDIGKPGGEKLMIKLGALLQMLTSSDVRQSSQQPPVAYQDVDSIIVRLADIFTKGKPNAAVVLDDVWDKSVIKHFTKLHCKCVIVTSRCADICDVSESLKTDVVKFPLQDGFTPEESQKYLEQALNKDKENLPPEAHKLHLKSSGSPLLLSLLGGLIKEYPDRWKYYLKKLEKREFQHESIDDAIRLSVEQIKNDQMRERFFDLAMFDDDVPIPLKVFATLWNIDEIEVAEDMMAYLVNSSLVIKEPINEESGEVTIYYRVHDLILQYARTHFPIKENGYSVQDEKHLRQSALADQHRRLIYKYRNLCGGKYENLEDDHYFHAFVGYHLSQAKMFADINEIYTNKEFLAKRLQYCSPEVVLVDAILLKKQHPSLTPLMVELENQIQGQYQDVKVSTPDVNQGRRPSHHYSKGELRRPNRNLSGDHGHRRPTNRNSFVDSSSLTAEVPPEQRARSSSVSQVLHESQSEPLMLDGRNGSSQVSGSVEVICREMSVPGGNVIQPVRFEDLRNDVFEDY